MRAVLLIVLLSSAAASAEPTAKQRFERGTTLYDLGKFNEAAHEYEAAFELKNDPALLSTSRKRTALGACQRSRLRPRRCWTLRGTRPA